MTFEEYCIKFSRRNIQKYSNDSNYSHVPRKKGRIRIIFHILNIITNILLGAYLISGRPESFFRFRRKQCTRNIFHFVLFYPLCSIKIKITTCHKTD